MWTELAAHIPQGDIKSLARAITLVENEWEGYEPFLRSLSPAAVPVIGITGPPGAGKSTLTDALIGELTRRKKKVAVLCVDPSSPFNLGALLGDRIRMSEWYDHPDVFIRSLATRGSLGGLHPQILEITELLKSAVFDYIIVETVGVGQSEVEIAGLADLTMVVVVPEAGDEVQTMKAGLMEIADLFVVNKADRPGADLFVKNLRVMAEPGHPGDGDIPVIKTVATAKEGTAALAETIERLIQTGKDNPRRYWLLAERAFHLIQKKRMKDIKKETLKEKIREAVNQGTFHLYSFIQNY